jgi:hypothetical protein
MKFFLFIVFSLCSLVANSAEWIDINLNQIEVTAPAAGGEGLFFAKDTPYVTSFSCPSNRYVVIRDQKLADRAISMALYAKSTSGKLRVYVSGCDSQGVISGVGVMLLP